METLQYLLWLHLKLHTLPLEGAKLFSFFHSIESIYKATKEDYLEAGIQNKQLLRLLADKNLIPAKMEIEKARRNGITLLGYNTEEDPSILHEIPDPPLVLYVKGDAGILHKRNIFCMVGTRNCTAYGMSATLAVAEQLASCGMIIISGVALGIDSGAHRGAIRGNGKTIGIMGCGLDVDYPAGNKEVKADIVRNGALVTEFPFGTRPVPSNFPLRNRLLSAFSLGVAVMEAPERSGALITAKYAAEQGRDVYALPGNISNNMSGGTNALIRDGATILLGAEDILAEYILRYPSYFDFEKNDNENVERKEETYCLSAAGMLQKPEVTSEERAIYSHITKEPKHINEIAREAGFDISTVQSVITVLQIKGKIKEHPGNNYSI